MEPLNTISPFVLLDTMRQQQACEIINPTVVPQAYTTQRRKLVDWIWEVMDALQMANPTTHLAVRLMDKFNSVVEVDMPFHQCVAAVCMMIACTSFPVRGAPGGHAIPVTNSHAFFEVEAHDRGAGRVLLGKLEERAPPSIKHFAVACQNEYTEEHLQQMELQILENLDWNVNLVTPMQFAGLYLSVCRENEVPETMVHLQNYTYFYLDLAAQDAALSLENDPSLIAAAATAVARWQLDLPSLEQEHVSLALHMHETEIIAQCVAQIVEYVSRCFATGGALAAHQHTDSPACVCVLL